jgi:hypothetical protein
MRGGNTRGRREVMEPEYCFECDAPLDSAASVFELEDGETIGFCETCADRRFGEEAPATAEDSPATMRETLRPVVEALCRKLGQPMVDLTRLPEIDLVELYLHIAELAQSLGPEEESPHA